MAEKQDGWIMLSRAIYGWRWSPIQRKAPFTQFEAWIWLLLAASYKNHQVGTVKVQRGQVLTSLVKLSKIWRRDRKTIRRWFKSMIVFGEIVLENGPTWTLITICKYNEFQRGRDTKGDTYRDTYRDTHRDTINNVKNVKNVKKFDSEKEFEAKIEW